MFGLARAGLGPALGLARRWAWPALGLAFGRGSELGRTWDSRGLKERGVSMVDVGKLALITAAPTLIGATVVYAPKVFAVLSRVWAEKAPQQPQPIGPPIERLATDLRRLLRLHDDLTRSAHMAMCAHRLWSVEAAIAVRATEAARALGVAHQEPPPPGNLTRAELIALLHSLADAGMVLPSSLGHFTQHGRL
ncbi:hypothetical protein Aco04nite_46110 [Winogradskya consettensis]|uniref:Uncharacterized protein n=2 Tax=Winogradskya consettensis TaxID=113560 RepID=A0A919SQ74_9ACTN|nr:hypothetical protein Aco04nite_46110 [Actinoplanes consettensis]